MKKKNRIFGILSAFTLIIAISTCMTFAASGRKLISKPISGSYYTNNSLRYSFSATAGISYTNDVIYAISDLSFSQVTITSTILGNTGTVVPRQISKTYSGSSATYVVQVTRTAQGVYSDKVNYTLVYRVSDAGTPYSLTPADEITVEIIESEPYDIVWYD
ncbi:hypothetical protein [Floccifex sp.]|uniref:hypothetical protein n=1 Tax=Floccifex sp. TaxID=2815810 RepID=UPI003F0B52C5